MATINLTTYVNVAPGVDHIDQIPSVEIPGKKTPPANRLLAMYGTKDSLAMLKKVRMQTRDKGLDTYRVDLQVDIGELLVGKAPMDKIKETRFLNIRRLKVDTAEALLDLVCTKETEHLVSNRSGSVDLLKVIGEHPHLLDKVWADPQFEHLAVICWPAPIPGTRMISGEPMSEQIAAVRPDAVSEVIVRNFEGHWDQATLAVTSG